MFCSNCGKENEEGNIFCTGCGSRILSQPSANIMHEKAKGTIIFKPKKIFGQFLLKYAVIDINGEKNKVRFKKELQIDLPAGDYDFMCYGNI